MPRYEKALAAAEGFARMYDPYELADNGMTEDELVEETVWLLMTEPYTVLVFFGGLEA